MSEGGRAAVFLDRDGTLITEEGYLGDPDGVRLFPGAAGAVRAWNEARIPVVLVTNQSGVARGLFDERALARVHERLAELLAAGGARLDAVYYCPHHPDLGEPPYRATCACRKPEPGLLLCAARELGLDLGTSWAVGDAARDLEAARRAGVTRLLLVGTGQGARAWDELDPATRASCVRVADLADAARRVLAPV